MAEADEVARRLLSLAVEFSNASRPLTTDEVHEAFYSGLSRRSFYVQFRRDRERLVPCGLVIRELGGERWEADRSSFADTIDADPDDLLALDLACLQLAADASFPYRHDLRRALAKVDQNFARREALAATSMPAAQGRRIRTLLGSRAARRPVRVRYVDAVGTPSERTLAIYGEFGLRGHTYFVACDLDEEGRASEPRVFRDDRFRSVRELAGPDYDIPIDFCASDWRRLPFQIGNEDFEATLAPPDQPSDAAREAMLSTGHVGESTEGRGVWHVWAASHDALASWAIAESFVPLAPAEVVDAWKSLLAEAIS